MCSLNITQVLPIDKLRICQSYSTDAGTLKASLSTEKPLNKIKKHSTVSCSGKRVSLLICENNVMSKISRLFQMDAELGNEWIY